MLGGASSLTLCRPLLSNALNSGFQYSLSALEYTNSMTAKGIPTQDEKSLSCYYMSISVTLKYWHITHLDLDYNYYSFTPKILLKGVVLNK